LHPDDIDFQAYSRAYDGRLLTDPRNQTERQSAKIVADHIGMPLEYMIVDDYRFFDRWSEVFRRWQQPTDNSTAAIMAGFYDLCAGHSRVALSGLGGDVILAGYQGYKFGLLRRGRLKEFAAITTAHLRRYHTLEGMRLRSGLKTFLGMRVQWRPTF